MGRKHHVLFHSYLFSSASIPCFCVHLLPRLSPINHKRATMKIVVVSILIYGAISFTATDKTCAAELQIDQDQLTSTNVDESTPKVIEKISPIILPIILE